MFSLIATALALPTRILADDAAAVAWIRENDAVNRTLLPVVGPPALRRLPEVKGHVRYVFVPESQDPDQAAIDARLDYGSPCALVLTPLPEGWAGYLSGSCGMLTVYGWRFESPYVIDGADRHILVTDFARVHGDREVFLAYRKLDRRRGGAIWAGLIGGGLLFSGSVQAGGASDPRPARAMMIGGGALLAGAGAVFASVQVDPRSSARRLTAHYTEDEIRQRVRAHNHRLKLAWTPLPTTVVGTF